MSVQTAMGATANGSQTVNLRALLDEMIERNASDLHITAGERPKLRVDGDIVNSRVETVMGPRDTLAMAYSILTEVQKKRFETEDELDFSFGIANLSRFRGNVYKQRGCVSMAIRQIPFAIKTFQELGLPPILEKMCEKPRGLVLVTGPTNSGKSTTLAAMVDHLNENMSHHILTLEDPLEFIHENKRCMINQRQIGEHSNSFADALRGALRADPNVILVGEMRDLETIALALTAAELGLLVMGTLHTRSAAQTISRVADAFPVDQQSAVRLALCEVLVGICSQQLLRRKDGKGRVAALEILVGTPAVRTMIREGKNHQVNNVIATGKKEGMKLLDQSLKDLVGNDVVEAAEAARFAEDPHALLALGRSGGRAAAPAPG